MATDTTDRHVGLWRPAAALLAAFTLAISGLAVVSAAADEGPRVARAAKPRIPAPAAFAAPIGKKGGISNPVVSCTGWRVDPKVAWKLTNRKTGWTHTWRWTGTLPGIAFPRVPVGVYRSKTTARCRGSVATRTHRVRVKEKTRAGTVSSAEWKQIHRGMTRTQVADIVGTDGHWPSRWDGELTLTYDMMAFWRWSLITYRDGRVIRKDWNVGHD